MAEETTPVATPAPQTVVVTPEADWPKFLLLALAFLAMVRGVTRKKNADLLDFF